MRCPPPRWLTAALVAALLGGCAEPTAEHRCPVTLDYHDDDQVERVEALGDWNGWSPGATPLLPLGDGRWRARLTLAPGDYAYRLRVDDALILDPGAPLLHHDEDEGTSSVLRVEDCQQPGWELIEARADASGELFLEARFTPAVTGEGLDPAATIATVDEHLVEATVEAAAVVVVEVDGLDQGKHQVQLWGRDRAGRRSEELRVSLWVEPTPFEWEGTLIYQVIIDRFALSGPPADLGLPRERALTARHGGDLWGLLEVVRSGYFESLGVGALWISPLYDNPDDLWPWYLGLDSSAYHGYWPVASRTVEPAIGGEEAVRQLVEELHRRGLRLIVDVVPNHVHIEHPYFTEHAGDGWFNEVDGGCVCGATCSWDGDIERCWFSEYLADLRWREPAVAAQVVDDTLWWLEAYDLDGLRIDAVPMMPLSATRELARATRQRFERGGAPVHLLGETYTGALGYETITRTLGPHGLDGQFDFPLMWEVRRVIGRGQGAMSDLESRFQASAEAWAAAGGGAGGRAIMSPFIGNHDVPRFLSEANGDELHHPVTAPPPTPEQAEPYQRLILAHTLTLTIPGAPVLYYGDELGLPGATDPDNRRPMLDDDELTPRQLATMEQVGRLGRLRRCLPSLRRGQLRTLEVDDDLWAYLRDADDGAPAIVVLNRAEVEREVRLELPETLRVEGEHRWLDGVGDELEVSGDGGALGPLLIPPLEAVVLVPEASGCAQD